MTYWASQLTTAAAAARRAREAIAPRSQVLPLSVPVVRAALVALEVFTVLAVVTVTGGGAGRHRSSCAVAIGGLLAIAAAARVLRRVVQSFTWFFIGTSLRPFDELDGGFVYIAVLKWCEADGGAIECLGAGVPCWAGCKRMGW